MINSIQLLRTLIFTCGMICVLSLSGQGWSQENSDYVVYEGGPALDMINVPSQACTGSACGTVCGTSTGSSGNYTTHNHSYTGTGVSINGDDLSINFTGSKTITARWVSQSYSVTFSLSEQQYNCQSQGGSSQTTDHTFTVTTEDFDWTVGALPSGCVQGGPTLNLYDYFSLGTGVSFTGQGVSGSTWSGAGLTAGFKTITATKVYDNGTATSSITVEVKNLPTVSFSNPPVACTDGTDINLFNYVNPGSGGTFSAGAGIDLQGVGSGTVDVSDSDPGTYTVTYSYTDGNSCTNTTTAEVTIDPAITIDAGANQSACIGEGDITLVSATSGVTWSCVGCSYVDGNQFDASTAPAGSYTVRASKTVGGCSDTDDKLFTVLASPTVGAGSDETYCIDDGVIALTTGTPDNGLWSGAGVNGDNFIITTAGVGTHTLTYTFTNAQGCEGSDSKEITVVALPVANDISITEDTRCGAGVVNLTASLTAHTINWYNASSGGTQVATGGSYSPSISVGTSTYYLEAVNSDGCVSNSRKAIAGIAYEIPTSPDVPDVERCDPGTVTLNASGGITGATYDWYENISGGSSLHTGAAFTTPSLSSTRSYYVSATSPDNCVSVARTSVDAIINSVPAAPTVFDAARCGTGVVTLSAAGAPSYAWYNSSTGGTSFNSTNSITVSLSETTSYWVAAISAAGCEGDRSEVVGTVHSVPAAPTVTGDNRCGSGTVTLTATGTNAVSYDWYDTQASAISLHSMASYSPSVTDTRSYWVEFIDANGCLSPRSEVIATVYEVPPNPTGVPAGRCGPGTVSISASGSGSGATYDWYENISGGSSLHTGATFTTPSLTSSKSYYVEATSTDGCLTNGRTEVLAEIYSFPGQPIVFDTERCGAGDVTLNVGGAPAGAQYLWYGSDIAAVDFHSGSSYSTTLAASASYWVSIVSAEGCEGDRAEITATINPIPNAPIANDVERCGTGSVTLSASSGVSGTFRWYETEASAVVLSTGSQFTTPSLTSTTSFWVDIQDLNTCVSNRTEVSAIVNTIPDAPIANDVESCGPGSVELISSGGPSGSTYRWYENSSGGSPVHVGGNFVTSVSTTRNYYVDVTSAENCTSTTRTEVTVTINSIPSEPTVFHGSNCGSGVVDLTVGGGASGSVYRWYENENDVTHFRVGSSYAPEITSTTSYWVSVYSPEGCEGDKAEVVATINSIPLKPVGADNERCGTGTVTLSASSSITGTFNWYETGASAISLGNSPSFTTPSISETTSFWVDITDANGCVSARDEVIATIFEIPQNPTAANFERCGAGEVNLSASGLTGGGIYEWYESASGGSSIHTGSLLLQTISETKTYYVEAISSDGCVSSGRTAVTATINPLPGAPVVFDGESCGAGLVTLTAAGAPAGGGYRWYEAESGSVHFHTESSFLANVTQTTSYWVSAISDKGCEGDRAEVVAIVNDIPGAPMVTDGNRCGNGSVSLSATASEAGVFNWYDTEVSSVSLFTGVNFNTPSLSSSRSYWVEFTDEDGCKSVRTEAIATIFEIIDDAVVENVDRCGPGEVTLTASSSVTGTTFEWYESQVGGSPVFTGATYEPTISLSRNYYVMAVSPDGCDAENRSIVTVTINSFPSAPSVTGNNTCGAGTVTLNASGASAGGTYNWYVAQTGGAVIANGSSFTTPSIANTTSYYVSILNADGCESERSEVVAEVSPFPDAPGSADVERCGTGNINLSASTGEVGATINWYFNSSGGSPFASGENITISNLEETTTYYAAVVSSDGCIGQRTATTASIIPVVNADIGTNIDLCVNSDPYDLTADLSGVSSSDGFFTGAGVVGNSFHPDIAGVGNHQITFVLTEEVGCTDNGSRIITVKNITSGGDQVTLSQESVEWCINQGLLDLTSFPSVSGGSWTSNAGASSITLGRFDPSVSGTGEFTAYYAVDVNGCTVQLELDITVIAAPAAPQVAAPDFICSDGVSASITNITDPSAVYYWYIGQATTHFETGTTIEVQPTTNTTYRVEVENLFGCRSAGTTFSVSVADGEIESSKETYELGELVSLSLVKESEYEVTSYLWNYGNGVTSTSATGNYYYFVAGVYNVSLEVETADGCTLNFDHSITIEEETDPIVVNVADENSLDIYPSPFLESFKINASEGDLIEVFDVSGTSRLKQTLVQGENTLNASPLTSGVYFARIISKNNVVTQKIVKK